MTTTGYEAVDLAELTMHGLIAMDFKKDNPGLP
jgi:hypothetical protein